MAICKQNMQAKKEEQTIPKFSEALEKMGFALLAPKALDGDYCIVSKSNASRIAYAMFRRNPPKLYSKVEFLIGSVVRLQSIKLKTLEDCLYGESSASKICWRDGPYGDRWVMVDNLMAKCHNIEEALVNIDLRTEARKGDE